MPFKKIKELHEQNRKKREQTFPKQPYDNHYDYLDDHLKDFFEKVGINWEWNGGIIDAHGDKTRGYKTKWEEAGIEFPQGTAVYLMTYCRPYSNEVRETKDDFIDPGQWVVDNYDRFKKHLPPNEQAPTFTFFWRNGIKEVIRTCNPKEVILKQDPKDTNCENFYIAGKYCYDFIWNKSAKKWFKNPNA